MHLPSHLDGSTVMPVHWQKVMVSSLRRKCVRVGSREARCWSRLQVAPGVGTIGGVPSLTPWIITIPGRCPVPPRPRGFREPPACGCSPAMQSGRRPPQTTGGNTEPEGRYQGSNGNSAPRAASPPLAAGAIALPRGALAMRPPTWRCSRDTEPTPAGRLGAAAFPPGSGPPLGQKCDLLLRASVVELLHPPWRGVYPARAP